MFIYMTKAARSNPVIHEIEFKGKNIMKASLKLRKQIKVIISPFLLRLGWGPKNYFTFSKKFEDISGRI